MKIKQLSKSSKGRSGEVSKVLCINDAVNIVYQCSKSCYANKLSDKFSDKLKHVRARVNTGHESVTEHSNIVMLISVGQDNYKDLMDAMGGFKYLNVESVVKDTYTMMLIGGSTRAYKNLIYNTSLPNHNKVIKEIKSNLYNFCYKEFFLDTIEAGVMDDNFIDIGIKVNDEWIDMENLPDTKAARIYKEAQLANDMHPLRSSTNIIDIINCDDIASIYHEASKYGFTINQCMSMATITIYFHNMSRIITQQLTRHRNAITQESQRYVDYTGKEFNNPAKFKPDKYKYNTKEEAKYYISGNSNSHVSGSMQDMGEFSVNMYETLVKYGVDKEDARYLLPGGVPSNLYVTFTFKNLIHFLNLRTDSHAQAEIRMYANEIDVVFRHYLHETLEIPEDADLTDYILPKYMMEAVFSKDKEDELTEYLESTEVEEEVDLTENDKKLKEAIKEKKWDPSKYASTREDEKEIKIAESGKRDV